MIKAFKKHLNLYFLFYPKTKKLKEFKEELLGTLMEKYQDLIAQGHSDEDSFDICIESINDYKETIEHIAHQKSEDLTMAQRKIICMGAAVYITFVILLYFVLSLTIGWALSWLTFIAGAFAGLIAIGFYLLRKAQRNSRFTIVRCAMPIIISLITTIIYLLISLVLKSYWHLTWIAYLIAVIIWYIIDIFYRVHHKANGFSVFDWLLISLIITLIVFFTVSFVCNAWSVSWICFIAWLFIAALGILIMKVIDYSKIDKNSD